MNTVKVEAIATEKTGPTLKESDKRDKPPKKKWKANPEIGAQRAERYSYDWSVPRPRQIGNEALLSCQGGGRN